MKEILIFSIGPLDLIIVSLFRYIIEGLTQTERERERERERPERNPSVCKHGATSPAPCP